MLQVEISSVGSQEQKTPGIVFGDEIKKLISRKSQQISSKELEKIERETGEILQPCLIAQNNNICETILVVGYVQSGKTLSFTALTALAKDNNYKTIIIISGTTNTLNDQTYKRMQEDLSPSNENAWVILQDPKPVNRPLIKSVSTTYKSGYFIEKGLVIIVKKNGTNLNNLLSTIRQVPQILDKPTLIIDDESDQASLNTNASRNDGTSSTINLRVNQIRRLFKNHTFLQYTATPQANLFISYLDSLSPSFIKFITPGDKYTGGETFFVDEVDRLVKIIPQNELPTGEIMDRAPESLVKAMMFFVIGIAIRRMSENRHVITSMMVHPSRTTNVHSSYYQSIIRVRGGWMKTLESKDVADKENLLKNFEEVFDDLLSTLEVGINFSSISVDFLLDIIMSINIQIINASNGKTPSINWESSFYHIIIGGTTLDRGTTVQGLTITYMPRSLGMGQVDTTLQRARFYGYKRDYLGYCRVWIDRETSDAYSELVEHEKDVRERLIPFAEEEKRLEEWNREVILSDLLNLTRPKILSHEIYRGKYSGWNIFNYPCESKEMVSNNLSVINKFIDNHTSDFRLNEKELKVPKDGKHHLYLRVPARICFEEFINQVIFEFPYEKAKIQNIKNTLSDYIRENPEEEVQIVLVGSRIIDGKIVQTCRQRSSQSINSSLRIRQLFQGRDPNDSNKYPGDSEFYNVKLWTIQIYKIALKKEISDQHSDDWQRCDLYTLAIRLPKSFERDNVYQIGNNKNGD